MLGGFSPKRSVNEVWASWGFIIRPPAARVLLNWLTRLHIILLCVTDGACKINTFKGSFVLPSFIGFLFSQNNTQ